MSKLTAQWDKQLQDPPFVLMKTVQIRDDKWKVTHSAPMSWRMLTMDNKMFDPFQIRKFWTFCTCFILFFAPYSSLWVLCDGLQCNIEEKNEIMNKLHNEMGPAVVKIVTDAHKEILEDNRSVYIMDLAWNFAEDQRATIKEVISWLPDVIKEKEKMLSGTRRHRKKWKKEADWQSTSLLPIQALGFKLERRKKLPL